MKRCLILFLFLIYTFYAKSQDVDSLTLSQLKLNFDVPDMPAFKLLGSDPSDLLKPSSPKALALTMSPFYDSQKFVIPKSFAMEISPALLINADKGPVELIKYSENAWINSFRISLGTATNTTLSPDGRLLALGFRITPVNKGDLTIDIGFQKKISERLAKFRERVRENYLSEFAIMKNIDVSAVDWEAEIFSDKKLKAQFDEYVNSREDQSDVSINKEIDQMKMQYKKDNWNATKFDIALALLSSSPDSLTKNIRFNEASLWLTYALRCGKKGQLLAGLKSSINKISDETSGSSGTEAFVDISVPVRYLLGTNRVKGIGEFQYEYMGVVKTSNVLLNLGIELNLTDGLWMDFTAGLQNNATDGSTSFITNLNVKLTFPESFEFF